MRYAACATLKSLVNLVLFKDGNVFMYTTEIASSVHPVQCTTMSSFMPSMALLGLEECSVHLQTLS